MGRSLRTSAFPTDGDQTADIGHRSKSGRAKKATWQTSPCDQLRVRWRTRLFVRPSAPLQGLPQCSELHARSHDAITAGICDSVKWGETTNLRCKNVEPPMSQMGQTPHRPQLRGDLIHDNSVRWPHQKNLVVAFDVFEPLQPVYARYGPGQPMQIVRLIE